MIHYQTVWDLIKVSSVRNGFQKDIACLKQEGFMTIVLVLFSTQLPRRQVRVWPRYLLGSIRHVCLPHFN